jgi:hypothetical protein
LSERGLLLIEVPNVEARCLHPDHRFHFAHFYNFNQVTLDAIARKAGFDLVQAATSSDGGNLIAIYRVAQGTPVAQGFSPVASNTSSVAQGFSPVAGNTSSLDALLAGNYARVRRILRGHTARRYYSSAAPYVAPLGRLRAFLKDRAASRGRATPREVLDQLIEQT